MGLVPMRIGPKCVGPKLVARFAVVLFGLYGAQARAAEAAPEGSVQVTPWGTVERRASRDAPQWVVGGFVDTLYAFNSNYPANHVLRGNYTSPRSGEFSPNLTVMYLRRDASRTEPWNLELALQAGAAADALHAQEPIAGGAAGRYAGPSVFRHISRANVGLTLPTQTGVAAGVFVSPISFGSFWTKDSWHASSSWSMNSVPYHLAGVRVVQPLSRKVLVSAWLVNGWQWLSENNDAPSGIVSFTFQPTENVALYHHLMFGPEQSRSEARYFRLFSDTQLVMTFGAWDVALVGEVGREQSIVSERLTGWATGKVQVRARAPLSRDVELRIGGRPEIFYDPGGVSFGVVDSTFASATLTGEAVFFRSIQTRLEYRFDSATSPRGFFYRESAITNDALLAQTQHTLFLQWIGSLENVIP